LVVWFLTYANGQTDRQKNRHTITLIAILLTPTEA